ncbi:hypothetical protein TNCV_4990051 [Trichonephila clavipes]|uniref:Uncharacterized protein n=1 Tax=Trichonephila clavipes TaxID=2585209 RepID=A0A8X6WBY4_TRICX|nr:hypothetical protein TNCV_4990051 [Trichonephila clavipes]
MASTKSMPRRQIRERYEQMSYETSPSKPYLGSDGQPSLINPGSRRSNSLVGKFMASNLTESVDLNSFGESKLTIRKSGKVQLIRAPVRPP